jgi:hypothetical protein
MSTNAGFVSQKERLRIMIKLKLMTLFMIFTIASGCTEFTLLASGSSLALSQNAYAKAYSSVDMLTIMSTQKSIKGHIYEKGKKEVHTLLRFVSY